MSSTDFSVTTTRRCFYDRRKPTPCATRRRNDFRSHSAVTVSINAKFFETGRPDTLLLADKTERDSKTILYPELLRTTVLGCSREPEPPIIVHEYLVANDRRVCLTFPRSLSGSTFFITPTRLCIETSVKKKKTHFQTWKPCRRKLRRSITIPGPEIGVLGKIVKRKTIYAYTILKIPDETE